MPLWLSWALGTGRPGGLISTTAHPDHRRNRPPLRRLAGAGRGAAGQDGDGEDGEEGEAGRVEGRKGGMQVRTGPKRLTVAGGGASTWRLDPSLQVTESSHVELARSWTERRFW
jgi:hypothetical protein